MTNDWLGIANLALNCLLIPLLWILAGIKEELAKLTATIASHATRLDRIEREQDR